MDGRGNERLVEGGGGKDEEFGKREGKEEGLFISHPKNQKYH